MPDIYGYDWTLFGSNMYQISMFMFIFTVNFYFRIKYVLDIHVYVHLHCSLLFSDQICFRYPCLCSFTLLIFIFGSNMFQISMFLFIYTVNFYFRIKYVLDIHVYVHLNLSFLISDQICFRYPCLCSFKLFNGYFLKREVDD